MSPGSRRTDHVVKHGEYTDGGIRPYWIIDIDEPVTLIACHLAPGFGYQDAPSVTGLFLAVAPFAAEIDPAVLAT